MAYRSALRRFASLVTDTVLRLLLRPQSRVPSRSDARRAAEIEARTGELNAAAERYFARAPYVEYLLGKPYSDAAAFPRYLFNLGVLLQYLRVGPGDRVLELGAGSCWVSHFLNLYGCRTISVDVSPTALRFGRRLFEGDARTRWDLQPLFLPYDGYRLPVADASVDRIVLHDAYHHIPNPDDVLREMARVLRPGGLVAMSEPGRDHSMSAVSLREVEEAGVLENDVVLEELDETARTAGFSHVTFVPVVLEALEIPAQEQIAFLGGKHFSRFWRQQRDQLLSHQYILLYKGEPRCTTRQPGRHAAVVQMLAPAPTRLRAAAGTQLELRCRVRNAGDSLWLHGNGKFGGETLLGARLRAESTAGEASSVPWRDWGRAALEEDVEPGEEAELALRLRVPEEPGLYRLQLAMVIEQVTWLSDRGSEPVELVLDIESVSAIEHRNQPSSVTSSDVGLPPYFC